jgi:hypothetical protein
MMPLTEYSATVHLAEGTRRGLRSYAPPELIRPDRPNPFDVIGPWNELIAENYVRNSDPTLRGNSGSLIQSEDFTRELLLAGYAVRVNDEQGISGGKIVSTEAHKNRRVFQRILARIIAGESHRLAVRDLSRLARDESGHDPAYIKKVVREHCNGEILTQRKTYNLFSTSDSRAYDVDSLMHGWRRQDDAEKAMGGYRRYVEDVLNGKRDITMPHRLSFGYLREPLHDPFGQIVTNSAGKVQTRLVLDTSLSEAMSAFRRAANVHNDPSRVARELNAANMPGPDRFRPIGQQWSRAAIRRILRQDIYAGDWTPMREVHSTEITTYLVRQGFDPREQHRYEPGLAWFTQPELDNWRAKLSTAKPINRQRKYDHPLLGILACDACSERLGVPVYMTRQGQQQISKTRGKENIYSCPERQGGRCTFGISEGSALAALALQVPAIQFRTTDVVTRIAEWASSGNVIRIQQAIRAKEDRRQWIDENLIRPCQEAGVRVDPKHIIEYAHLAEECDNLKRELDGLGAQTEALSRATDVLRALGGDLKKALPLLNTQGQGVVYGALITAAYLSGSGFGRGRTNTVRRFTTVAESNVYSQDEDNQAVQPELRVNLAVLAWLGTLADALSFTDQGAVA